MSRFVVAPSAQDHQELLAASFAAFLADTLPLASDRRYTPAHWGRFCAVGGQSVLLGEDDGGGGGTMVDALLVVEAAGRVAAPLPVAEAVAVSGLVSQADTVVLDALLAGDVVVPVEVDRPARGRGETVRGEARNVLWGAEATHLVVELGGRFVVVDAAAAGVVRTPTDNVARLPMADIRLDDAPVVAELAGGDPSGRWRRDLALARCALMVGAARAALDATCDHVTDRCQFGAPIGSFQAVQHRLADAYVELEGAAGLLFRAAEGRDDPAEHRRRVLLAVEAAARAGRRAVLEANQLFGGYGFTLEYPPHVFNRYVTCFRLYVRGWAADEAASLAPADLVSGRPSLRAVADAR